jgi:hypothetical protein
MKWCNLRGRGLAALPAQTRVSRDAGMKID